MLERAVRCLKTGGQAAFAEKKKQLRSQRHLHSAFWSHGAGNIDLPTWWIFLLQTPATVDRSRVSEKGRDLGRAVSTGLEDIFLDFLYPVQTIALIRRLRQSTRAHHRAAQNVKQYHRSYTSIATDFITGVKATEEREETYTPPPTPSQAGIALRNEIYKILESKDQSGRHDDLWQRYQDLLEMSQVLSPQVIIKLLRCLIMSKRKVDVERALALFESIPVESRRAIHYSHAVSAALTLKDVDTAVAIHREAMSRISGSVGTAAIMGYAVQQELWTVAIEVWHTLWDHKLAYYTRPDIWIAVESLPLDIVISKASASADFATSFSESTGSRGATAAREFALELIRRAFSTLGSSFDINQHWDLVNKVTILEGSDPSLRVMALTQLLSIDGQEYGHRGLHLYRLLRKGLNFSPTRDLLETLSQRLLAIKSVPGLLMILADWRTYFATVPARLAVNAARIFGKNGHLEATQKVLDSFVLEHGKPRHNSLYHSLLLAHSRRADTEGIVRCLDHLQEAFSFEPGVKAWNSIISTFARVGNIDGALVFLKQLRDSGNRPDSTTFSLLMSMYAKRGDRDAVDDLYEQSKVEGITTTTEMVDAVVLVNVNEGNLEEAERLIDQASQMDLQRPPTFMWNVLLNAYALRKEIEKVSQLHKRMQEAGVSSDNMTYAALMTSLTVAKYPDGARKIMDTVMPRNKIKRTALHYAIVMEGYLKTQQYGEIFQLYKQMLKQNLSPNMSTQNVLLRAAASVDKATLSREEGDVPDQTEFIRAKQTFDQTVANLDPIELAASEPRKFVGPSALNEAFSSTYFEYLIFLYGTEGAFTKASELYELYISTTLPLRGGYQDIETSPPMRLLSALMVAHIRANNHAEVDRCWNLALEQCDQMACKSGADTFRGNFVLRSRRFIINLPLHQYIKSLTHQTRTADLIDTVRNLQHAGYALNSPNWNIYIQALARSSNIHHRNLAFELCERELIPNWPGWSTLGDPRYMKAKFRAAQRDMMLKQDQKAPTYLTLVWLARAYLEAKSLGRGGTMRRLEQVGRRTVDAITNMPRLNDRAQSEILRQEI